MNSGVVRLVKSVLKSLYDFDKKYMHEHGIICGIDEAGRGPLAGDVFAAAVVFDEDTVIDGINDSKKLTAKKREYLFDIICEKAKAFSIATASVEEIEEINILNAAMLAMYRAYDDISQKLDINYVLVDGNRMPKQLNHMGEPIVKGDAFSQSIAAASILAKVARDRYAVRLDYLYPEYGFARHKGYGTKLHIENILKYGPCDIHRKSFLKKILGKKKDE